MSDRGAYHRLLWLFVDGVGLRRPAADNPLSSVAMPTVWALLGGPLATASVQEGPTLRLRGLDSCLGVPGLPQSATGQTSLFSGVNAARALGRHVPAFPGTRLRAILSQHSVLRRAVERGLCVTFANAYTPSYAAAIAAGQVRASATSLAVAAAKLPFRATEELRRGEAVPWDVRGDLFSLRAGVEVPQVGAEEAGGRLARLAAAHDLTLWETFLTDLAGHQRRAVSAEEALRRLDGLLAGVLAERDDALSVLLTSDHGNLEEAGHRRHTRNPVPLLVVGPAADAFAGVAAIDEIVPRVLDLLSR